AHAGHGPVIRAAAIGRTACALRDALAVIGERDLIAHDFKWAPDRDRPARSPGGSPALKELPGADMLERAGPHRNCFGRGDCKGIAVSPGRYSAKESGRGTCEEDEGHRSQFDVHCLSTSGVGPEPRQLDAAPGMQH